MVPPPHHYAMSYFAVQALENGKAVKWLEPTTEKNIKSIKLKITQ